MPQTPFARWLSQTFGNKGTSAIAQLVKIDPARVSRLLSGEVTPSEGNVLRFAAATGTPPTQLFLLVGMNDLAAMTEHWEAAEYSTSSTDASRHRRLQRLLELGMAREVDQELARLEAPLTVLQRAFESFCSEARVTRATLRVRDRVLFDFGEEGTGTQREFAHGEVRLSVEGMIDRKQAEFMLRLWSASLRLS